MYGTSWYTETSASTLGYAYTRASEERASRLELRREQREPGRAPLVAPRDWSAASNRPTTHQRNRSGVQS